MNTQVEAGAPLVALQAPAGQAESREQSGSGGQGGTAAEFADLATPSQDQ